MKLEYRPLSSIQIHEFLERNHIDALDIKEIGNYTVILYQTPDEQGDWQLTSDENSRISGSRGCSCNNSDIAKVSIAGSEGGGGDRGYISFISLIINDNEILEKADRIVINNKDHQSEEFVNKRKELIISDFGDERSEELIITLLDKTGNELFYSKGRRIGNKVIDRINDLKRRNNSMQYTEPLKSQIVLKRLQRYSTQ